MAAPNTALDELARRQFNTPEPQYVNPPRVLTLAEQPWKMEFHERAQVRAAAFRATKLWPGGVGELISRELISFEELGLRLERGGHIMRAVRDILNTPMPPDRPVSGEYQAYGIGSFDVDAALAAAYAEHPPAA